jgi:hypothetical protein
VHPGCIRTARLSSCGVLRASEIIVRVDVIGLLCAQFRCDLDLLVLFESMCRFLCYSFGWRRIATKLQYCVCFAMQDSDLDSWPFCRFLNPVCRQCTRQFLGQVVGHCIHISNSHMAALATTVLDKITLVFIQRPW